MAGQRRFRRYVVADATLSIKKDGALALVAGASSTVAPLINLGRGGLEFVSPEPFRDGTKLAITLHLPAGFSPLKLKGVVTWRRRVMDQDNWRVGVEFQGISGQAKKNLELIERHFWMIPDEEKREIDRALGRKYPIERAQRSTGPPKDYERDEYAAALPDPPAQPEPETAEAAEEPDPDSSPPVAGDAEADDGQPTDDGDEADVEAEPESDQGEEDEELIEIVPGVSARQKEAAAAQAQPRAIESLRLAQQEMAEEPGETSQPEADSDAPEPEPDPEPEPEAEPDPDPPAPEPPPPKPDTPATPKGAGEAKLVSDPIPVYKYGAGHKVACGPRGLPTGNPGYYISVPHIQDKNCFCCDVLDDSMSQPQGVSFDKGDLLIFSPKRLARTGDFAFVVSTHGAEIRQIFFEDNMVVRLRPLNCQYGELSLQRRHVKAAFKLIGRYHRL